MIKINLKDDIAPKWAESIRSVSSVHDLIQLCKYYGNLTRDALEIAEKMTDDDVIEFKEGLLSEARGIFAGEEWAKKYSNLFMPDVMVDVSLVADKYNCPEGTAYHRMLQEGFIK